MPKDRKSRPRRVRLWDRKQMFLGKGVIWKLKYKPKLAVYL